MNRCIICKVDMGEHNPRQFCRKTYCPQEELDSIESKCTQIIVPEFKNESYTIIVKTTNENVMESSEPPTKKIKKE
jgi:hypothetical protein